MHWNLSHVTCAWHYTFDMTCAPWHVTMRCCDDSNTYKYWHMVIVLLAYTCIRANTPVNMHVYINILYTECISYIYQQGQNSDRAQLQRCSRTPSQATYSTYKTKLPRYTRAHAKHCKFAHVHSHITCIRACKYIKHSVF